MDFIGYKLDKNYSQGWIEKALYGALPDSIIFQKSFFKKGISRNGCFL